MTEPETRRSLAWLPVVGLLMGAGFLVLLTLSDVLIFDEDLGPALRGNLALAVVFAVIWSVGSWLAHVRGRRGAVPS